MDEIEIILNGIYVFSFFETSLMMCGENVKNSALFDVAEKILPAFVWKLFLEWHKHSSWDGDNETKEIKHGIITYRFFNHYWD